jgi:hypothetical protein
MRYHQILNEKRVLSSWIADLTYTTNDEEENGVMMTLLNSKEYFIVGISPKVYNQWVKAKSNGKCWHRYVKGAY